MKKIQVQVIHRRLGQIKIDTLEKDYWSVEPFKKELILMENGKTTSYEVVEVTFLNWIKIKQIVQIIYID